MAQEALTNIIRHARAQTVSLELHRTTEFLHFVVRDDGIGFDVGTAQNRARQGVSLGLLGMHERFALGRRIGLQVRAWLRHGSPRLSSCATPTGRSGAGGMKIRVLLADDHELVRAGIRSLLEKMTGIEVVAEAGDGREALELTKKLLPEVVLLDIAIPELNGLEALARMTKEFPAVKVIILSMHANEEYVLQALKAGACGYLVEEQRWPNSNWPSGQSLGARPI